MTSTSSPLAKNPFGTTSSQSVSAFGPNTAGDQEAETTWWVTLPLVST